LGCRTATTSRINQGYRGGFGQGAELKKLFREGEEKNRGGGSQGSVQGRVTINWVHLVARGVSKKSTVSGTRPARTGPDENEIDQKEA